MLKPGTVLQNRYRVEHPLGKGGQGTVYEAIDERLQTIVALKETSSTEDLEREALILAKLKHEALPRVTDHFGEGSSHFLVMEYISGQDLKELQDRQSTLIPLDQVLHWAETLLDALEYLHTHQPPIIHRDIKPQNIKLTDKGKIVLLDFGLAKHHSTETSQSVHGFSTAFSPIEQIQNTPTDARSDIFSLGATLYRLMTGHSPSKAEVRNEHVKQGAFDPLQLAHTINSQIPPAISLVLRKAMALKPEDRYPNVVEFRRALQQADHSLIASPAQNSARRIQITIPPPVLSPPPPAKKPLLGKIKQIFVDSFSSKPETISEPSNSQNPQIQSAPSVNLLSQNPPINSAFHEDQIQTLVRKPPTQPPTPSQPLKHSSLLNKEVSLEPLVTPPSLPTPTTNNFGTFGSNPHREQQKEQGQYQKQKSQPRKDQPSKSVIKSPPTLVSASLSSSLDVQNLVTPTQTTMKLPATSRSSSSTTSPASKPEKSQVIPLAQNYKNSLGMEFVLIQAGSFNMGSSKGNDDERPVHQVKISEAFYFGKYAVTQKQWKAVMGSNPSYFKGDDLPIENVSWEEVQEFVQKLNEKGEGQYRLPTEAEWEYACRATTTEDYAGKLEKMGWYDGNSDGKTHPVGQKSPNEWGLYDMHGNVWEWCEDWYKPYPSESVTDPKGPVIGSNKVARGGSWNDYAFDCRSAFRYDCTPNYRTKYLGFRLVRVAERTAVLEKESQSISYKNNLGMEFIPIPSGSFEMGSTHLDDEKPIHRVTISKRFYLGKYQVTQAQWEMVMGYNPSRFKGEDLPVESVSWDEVQDFILKLNEKGEGSYRLPTEAEWEYACRAGMTEEYAEQLDEIGWYDGNSDGKTHPVGQKSPNKWGLYDMHGNVWEWCADWFGKYPEESVIDPKGPATGSIRVGRGGSWKSSGASSCRFANRDGGSPSVRYISLGFRLVKIVEE